MESVFLIFFFFGAWTSVYYINKNEIEEYLILNELYF